MIYSVARGTSPNIKARHFHLSNGGYDTHSDQGGATGQHFDLHAEIGQALQLFYNDLADMSSGAPSGSGLQNLADKVVTVVYSEFSRRIPQNDNGTDHGSQGPVLVIGGGVNGGVYGDHPNIDESALDDDGNTVYKQDTSNGAKSTDLRDVYGTIIKHWLGVTTRPVWRRSCRRHDVRPQRTQLLDGAELQHGLPALTDSWRTVWGPPSGRPWRAERAVETKCRRHRPPDGYGAAGGRPTSLSSLHRGSRII